MTGLSTAEIHQVAFHECAHAVIAHLAVGAPVKRLWMARQAVDGRFGGCTGMPVRTDPINIALIALAGACGESIFTGEPVERLLRRCTTDRRAALAALALCDEDMTIAEARTIATGSCAAGIRKSSSWCRTCWSRRPANFPVARSRRF